MHRCISSLAVASLALLATPAAAAQLNVTVTGTITNQLNEMGNYNTGVDPNLAVGDTLTLTASFDSSRLIPWDNFGYSAVGLYGLPTTGSSFFRIDGSGLTWQTSDDFNDGWPPLFRYDDDHGGYTTPGAPIIIVQGDKVVGLVGLLSPVGGSRPGLTLGSYIQPAWQEFGTINGQLVERDNFAPATLSDQFSIHAANGIYGNTYNTPGFTGIWDFADSSVVDSSAPAVPEPTIWVLFLMGFGAIGWTLRAARGSRTSIVNSRR
jgi:hypothetical protein